MGVRLQVVRMAQGVVVTLAEELIEQNVGYWPAALGRSLADQVIAHSRDAALGYFPAFDYFRTRPDVDAALLALIDEVAAYAAAFASQELRRRLSRAFSNVAVQQVQPLVYAMPRVRPAQPDTRERLARHFTPNRVKVELLLSSIERGTEGVETLAGQKVVIWTKGAFADLQLLAPRLLA